MRSLTVREAIRAVSPDFVVRLVRRSKAAARQLGRFRALLAPGPAILMYHRVAHESFDPFGLAVSPANFAEQAEWIARNRTPLPLAEFVELNRRGRLPPNAIAVTFDDGYSCTRTATTVLERFRIPATVFIPADLIERGREFWWDELERIVLGHAGATLRLDGREIHLGEAEPGDRQWAHGQQPRTERQRACNQLWSSLYKMEPRKRARTMEDLREQAKVPDTPRDSHRPLTVAEIRGMQSEFVEFGSHALSHTSLPLLSPDEKSREIAGSMARCADITAVRPRSFCYPYGDFDPEAERLVEEAGFCCACKATGWFVTRSSNRFALPRIAVGDWDSARLARELGRP